MVLPPGAADPIKGFEHQQRAAQLGQFQVAKLKLRLCNTGRRRPLQPKPPLCQVNLAQQALDFKHRQIMLRLGVAGLGGAAIERLCLFVIFFHARAQIVAPGQVVLGRMVTALGGQGQPVQGIFLVSIDRDAGGQILPQTALRRGHAAFRRELEMA